MNLLDRITIKPGRRSGKPCIRDSRITVYDVFGYLAAGMTEQEILRDFPQLTHEDILACHAYGAQLGRRTFSPREALPPPRSHLDELNRRVAAVDRDPSRALTPEARGRCRLMDDLDGLLPSLGLFPVRDLRFLPAEGSKL